jgi:MtN3 and saliva related transmembrane protein
MSAVTLVGLVAAFCTTFAYLPQAIRTLRTRSTEDLSLGMLLVLVAGTALWLAYGLLLPDLPLVVANGITFLLTSTILACKLRYG